MTRNKFLEWLGFELIANHNTKEIHIARKIVSRCGLSLMRNATYVSKRKAKRLYKQGYNGCRFCNKQNDNG